MWLSIMGMYEYDNTIFDGMDIPTYTDTDNNVHVIDKSTVINNICLKCAELELIYSKIDTMKLAIGVWSVANQETWRKMIETQFIKYNPIWNVDADETEKLQHGHTETRTLDYDDTTTRGTTDTTTRGTTETTTRGTTETTTRGTTETRTPNLTDTQRPNTTNTESVKGFNSSNWSEAKKVDNSGYATYEQHGNEAIAHSGIDTVANTGVDTVANSGNDTVVHTGVDTLSHDGTDTMAHTGIDTTTKRRTGNIGVTTTQKMIAEQREVAEFNIIDYITESFKNRFCLLIY